MFELRIKKQIDIECYYLITARQQAYPDIGATPKFHYSLHNGPEAQKLGMLLTTFPHERKHRTVHLAFKLQRYMQMQL